VEDIGPKGLVSSQGSDGSMPTERIAKYGRLDEAWADSLVFNALTTKEVVERLIVCDGQPRRGFRASMFSPDLKMCGVATAPHKDHTTVIQMIYVDRFLEQG